jgi:LEA14-like dessication related protein
MERRAGLLLVVAGLVLTAACSKPKPPQLTPRSAQVTAVLADGVELALELNAHNPNSFPIIASNVTAAFELQDGTPLGSGSSTESFTIPSEGDAPINAKLQVRFSSLSVLAPYALQQKALPYRIRGSARIGSEHLNVDLPFSIDGQLTPEQVMAAGLRGAANFLQKK